MVKKERCKFDDNPPHQEKFLQDGAPYPTNALPLEDPNITDRAIDIRTPYGGTYNPRVGQFMHSASQYVDEAERAAAPTGIVVHIKPL